MILMGLITIEIPQKIKKSYRISSATSGETVIAGVEKLVNSATKGDSKRDKRKVSLEGLVGLWADKPESAERDCTRPEEKE